MSYGENLFTNIQKQFDMLKISLPLQEITNFMGK